jgi:hypothetical protein
MFAGLISVLKAKVSTRNHPGDEKQHHVTSARSVPLVHRLYVVNGILIMLAAALLANTAAQGTSPGISQASR